ncbi:MAG: ABC transporter substrate-binding protein [Prevotellaceae bacterium]|jgi:iron complex transport system substrate-binding protein|nr:ABC transporter substrate-binding protein [Prevotellaceae bacterium]
MNRLHPAGICNSLSLLLSLFLLPLASCSGGGRGGQHTASGGDTLQLHYADYLRLIDRPGYTLAELRNPWDTTKLLHTYILIPAADSLPPTAHLPEGTVVRTPVRRSLVYSSVHLSLLKDLDAQAAVAGVCDLKYIRMPEIHTAVRGGAIADCGDSMNPDIERVISLHPDAILLSPFENSGGYGRVEKLAIPLIECADYMESSPLGRAEWMRFYGRLYGRAAQADSLFDVVEQHYNAMKMQVAATSHRPSVMCDLITGSTWYTPGGQSTVARLYADAGAHYIFADDTHTGSLPYTFERIYERGRDADFWLIRYNQPTDKTYSELASEFAGYRGFRAFRECNIYGCNTGIVPFYEEVPFHPDRFLQDLIRIFHPETVQNAEQKFYRKLSIQSGSPHQI